MPAGPRYPAPRSSRPGRHSPTGVLQVDWPFFGELCRALALKVYRDYEPDLVLGIAKAGVIPGAVISSILQCDFASMAITRADTGSRPVVIAGPPALVTGRQVLIVDETCDSGDTMKLALHAVRELKPATASEEVAGLVRVLHKGWGWGVASFSSLARLPAMVARAGELSRAVRLDDPIRLAEVFPREADAVLDLDGDVRGVPLAEKKRLLEAYNGAMLAVGDRVVDTQASYRDEVSEGWDANSEGTLIYQLRPEVVLSGTAIARRDGVIEKGLESLGYRKGWNAAQGRETGFRAVAERAVALLDAPGVKGGTYPVVLDPQLGGVFLHDAVGHLSEADFVDENAQ